MNYVGDVANAFLTRCGSPRILRPMDYAVIAEWEKQEIPLATVVNSINEVCDELEPSINGIESVSYFQDAVRKNFRAWLKSGQS